MPKRKKIIERKKIEIKKLSITEKNTKNSLLTDESYDILKKSQETCEHFLSIYDILNKSKGKPTDKNQDLLRAMLVFSSSALDVVLKSLIRSNLRNAIKKKKISKENFNKFVKRNVGGNRSSTNRFYIDLEFLANSLSEENPRVFLIQKYIEDTISGSLQSKPKIIEIGKKFGFDIEKETKIKINEYDIIFKTRNEIIHQMDISKDEKNTRKRIQRKRDDLVKYTNNIFLLIEFFILEINKMYVESNIDSTSNK